MIPECASCEEIMYQISYVPKQGSLRNLTLVSGVELVSKRVGASCRRDRTLRDSIHAIHLVIVCLEQPVPVLSTTIVNMLAQTALLSIRTTVVTVCRCSSFNLLTTFISNISPYSRVSTTSNVRAQESLTTLPVITGPGN